MGKGGINLPQGVLPWQSSLFASGYSTTKSVRVYSWSVPPATLLSPTWMPEDAPTVLLTDASVRRRVILVYYGLCLAVAVYVGIYMMLWHRGYQKIDTMRGTVHTKIKGSATGGANLDPALAGQSWDAEDLVRYYTDGFFMPTTFHRTTQTQVRARAQHISTYTCTYTRRANAPSARARTSRRSRATGPKSVAKKGTNARPARTRFTGCRQASVSPTGRRWRRPARTLPSA